MKSTGSIFTLLLLVAVPNAKAYQPSDVYTALLAKYDADKDGRLDTVERETIRTDRLKPKSSERSSRRRFRYPDEGHADSGGEIYHHRRTIDGGEVQQILRNKADQRSHHADKIPLIFPRQARSSTRT